MRWLQAVYVAERRDRGWGGVGWEGSYLDDGAGGRAEANCSLDHLTKA